MSAALNTTDDEFEFDLDKARTARREIKRIPAIRIGGERLELPVELPVDVLAPLTELDVDVSLLVRMAIDARKKARADGDDGIEAILDSVIDIFIANPKLPQDLVEAVKTMARRLFGEPGYNHLAANRLTLPDLGELAKFIGRQYGVGLGEALPSSDSSEGTGTTSNQTSSGSTAKTSAASGKTRARRVS